jgi:hypothetical protein
MSASRIDVYLVDADGPAWRDTHLQIFTREALGTFEIDATQVGGNTDALKLTGVGTGLGLLAAGGTTAGGAIGGVLTSHVSRSGTAQAGGASTITLDASAVATDDYYNGSMVRIVSGTGVGQTRFISDYVGSTKVATVNRSWSTNPSSASVYAIIPHEDVWDSLCTGELSAIPSATSSMRALLLALWERFFYKRTQTATTFTQFKADSSTSLGTATVADDGTTQTTGKIA